MQESIAHQLSVRCGIVAANNTGYVEAMLSCIEAGNIAVPLRNIDDRYRIEAANITQIVTPTEDGVWMRRKFTPANTSEIALIAFTSGTEGNPKGVTLMHKNLAEVVARLNSVMHLDESISEYIGVPVYHSFGFGRCRAVATAGGKFFIPSNGFNPSEIGEMLKKGEINAISAVPSLWRVLLANKEMIGSYGKKVRWIEIGSQYMSRQEKEQMKALFPEARIVQHYGLTEASRTTLLPIHEVEGDLLESVGQALGSVEVKLTSVGQIAIRGHHVAQSYIIDGQEIPLQDEDGWFLTKDLGSLENGYLYYKGRADDVINCGGIKVYPEALETKIYASIGRSGGLAICRKQDSMRGEGFLVAVTKEVNVARQHLREAVLQATQELGVNAGNAITIVDVDSLPKTATGKIQRKQLAEWYAKEFSAENQSVDSADNTSDASPIQAIFRRVLNISEIKPQESFISLGGDSLSYIQFAIQLENYLGNLPKRWEQMSLSELEKLVPQRKKNTALEMDVLLRAIGIFSIIFLHALLILEYYIIGGSLLLLVIVGLNFARFQGYALLKGNVLEAITPILKNLIIPYLVIIVAYQIWQQKFDLSVLLMFNNFLVYSATDVEAFPFPFWFICLLVQIIIGFSLLLLIKPVRHFAKSSPWRFGLILLLVGTGVNILSTQLWYPNELYYPRAPHTLFWLFALGWCLQFAQSKSEKLITTGIFLIIMSIMFMQGITPEKIWILIGGSLLLWVPFVSVPPMFKSVIQTISAATYYIYMTHILFLEFNHNFGIAHPWMDAIVSLLGSVLLWFSIQKLQQFRAKNHSNVAFSLGNTKST